MPDSAYITVVRRYRPHDQGLQDYHPVQKWKQLLFAMAHLTPGQPLVCPPASCLPASWPWSPAAS